MRADVPRRPSRSTRTRVHGRCALERDRGGGCPRAITRERENPIRRRLLRGAGWFYLVVVVAFFVRATPRSLAVPTTGWLSDGKRFNLIVFSRPLKQRSGFPVLFFRRLSRAPPLDLKLFYNSEVAALSALLPAARNARVRDLFVPVNRLKKVQGLGDAREGLFERAAVFGATRSAFVLHRVYRVARSFRRIDGEGKSVGSSLFFFLFVENCAGNIRP